MKLSALHPALRAALLLGLLRLLAGLGLMAYALWNPEAHMLALLDVLTVTVYLCSTVAGFPAEISDAGDLTYLLVGTVTWASLGAFGAVLIARFNRARGRDARGSR